MNNTNAWPFPTAKTQNLFHQTDPYATPVVTSISVGYAEIEPDTSIQDYLVENQVRIMHCFDPNSPRGGVTIAYRKTSAFKNTKMVEVAVAYCSPNDSFSKKIGTALALDYFSNGQTILVPARQFKCDDFTTAYLRNMFYTAIFGNL